MRITKCLLIALPPIFLLCFANVSFADGRLTKKWTGAGTKTENFDNDPGWVGVNFRSAQAGAPRTMNHAVRREMAQSK